MNTVQSNTREGLLTFIANEDLTNKEGYVVELIPVANARCKVGLPNAASDVALYVIESGAAIGLPVDVRPLEPNRNVRLVASGAIAGGAAVALVVGGAVRTITGLTSGTYWIVGYAEEAAADTGKVLVRPCPRPLVVP